MKMESRLLQSVVNEVLNGFEVADFDAVIGVDRAELQQLLAHLDGLPDDAEIKLNQRQTKAFRNALRETLHELGVEEFHTRTGFAFEEGEEVLKKLDHIIAVDVPPETRKAG